MRSILIFFLFVPFLAIAQKKQITLEDIYKKGTFRGDYAPGFTKDEEEKLFNKDSVFNEKGEKIKTGDYMVSADKKRILFFDGREPIYRRSSKSTVYVYDVSSRKAVSLNSGKVLHPTVSPDGSKVAYVFDNNLYIYDIASAQTKAVTTDGKW